MRWKTAARSGQTKRISFLGDAINLDFISKRAVKEPREREEPWKCSLLSLFLRSLSSERFSSHECDAAIRRFSPRWHLVMPLCTGGGHSECKHELSASVYLIMTQWLAAHVSLSRLKWLPPWMWTSGEWLVGKSVCYWDIKHQHHWEWGGLISRTWSLSHCVWHLNLPTHPLASTADCLHTQSHSSCL